MSPAVLSTMKKFAREDWFDINDQLRKKIADIEPLNFKVTDESKDGKDIASVYTEYRVDGEHFISLSWTYTTDDDSDQIYMNISPSQLKNQALSKIENEEWIQPVKSSVTASRRPILGAEGDEDELSFDEPDVDFGDEGGQDDLLDEGDGVDDALDNMADAVEDMQDSIDNVEPDEPNIEVDNNIDGHYIAECDRCQGVFISAVIQSDQEVTKISGVCPLCGKESDQYLKWVIKSVE